MMFADRLLALALVAAVLAVAWLGLTWRSRRFRRRIAADLLADRRPLVLAFSTPDCVPCKTIQKPALEELQRRIFIRLYDAQLPIVETCCQPVWLNQHFRIRVSSHR